MLESSFLVQRFAKLDLGSFHIIGYSVAGEETVVQVPELGVCFDIGRSPHFALTSNIICISHGHMDHVAGLAYYVSQRHFQGMKPGTLLVPEDLARPVDQMLRCWRDVERQVTPYALAPMSAGSVHQVRKDFVIRAFETHHGGCSLGYALVSVREKLKPEYLPLPGPEIAALRRKGVEIQYRLEVPLVAYLGDTTAGRVFENPDVRNAEVLLTECTFFDASHKSRAKVGKHLHLDALAEVLPALNNKHIIILHVSRRISVRRARNMLRRRIGDEKMQRIHFLMDFERASEAGDVEQEGLPPPDQAE